MLILAIEHVRKYEVSTSKLHFEDAHSSAGLK